VSGKGNHGTLTNMDPASDWVMTEKGWALDFDGVTDHISAPIPHNLASFSWVGWARRTVNARTALFNKGTTANNSDKLLEYTALNALRYFIRGVVAWDFSGSTVTDANWHLIGMTFDGTTLRGYFDGLPDGSSAAGNTPADDSDTNFFIGYQPIKPIGPLTGQCSMVAAYSRILTPSEIQLLYDQPNAIVQPRSTIFPISGVPEKDHTIIYLPKKLSHPSFAQGFARNARQSANPGLWNGLVGAWHPGLGVTGETLRDVSGFGNHGTLTNMDPASDWAMTEKGWALDLAKNANESINFTGLEGLVGQDFTISMWYRLNSYDAIGSIFFSTTNGVGNTLYFQIGSSNKRFSYAGGFTDTTIPVDWPDGKLHHLSVVFTSAPSQLVYQDGVLYGSDTDAHTAFAAGPKDCQIGNYIEGVNWEWDGIIANFAIHARPLTPSEIQLLYTDPWAMYRPRLMAFPGVAAAVAAGFRKAQIIGGGICA
jgi:hypothetical protein